MQNLPKISESRFYMWRGIFALAHVDGVVSAHELSFLDESTKDLQFSDAQRKILEKDLDDSQDAETMFAHISDARDRAEFFILARVLCWSDGDFDAQERSMMELLDGLDTNRDAAALLQQSKMAVQEIRLNADQWVEDHADERPVFAFFKRLLPI